MSLSLTSWTFCYQSFRENQLQGDFSNFYQINFELLQNLYIEQLRQPKIFEDAIIEFQLIDRKDFNNEESFNKAVIALALNIEIIEPPKINNRSDADNFPKFWEIKFSYTDEDKWKNILSSVHNDATGNVKKILQDRFNKTISITKQKKEFEIDDILYEINNALDEYEIQTSYLLVYLKEQAEIAKALGIAKSTIEAQMFSAQNGMLNIEFDTPFYLKGYEAIEKEIELIKTRKTKEAFIEGFFRKTRS